MSNAIGPVPSMFDSLAPSYLYVGEVQGLRFLFLVFGNNSTRFLTRLKSLSNCKLFKGIHHIKIEERDSRAATPLLISLIYYIIDSISSERYLNLFALNGIQIPVGRDDSVNAFKAE